MKTTASAALWFWEDTWSFDDAPNFVERVIRLYPRGKLIIAEYGNYGAYVVVHPRPLTSSKAGERRERWRGVGLG